MLVVAASPHYHSASPIANTLYGIFHIPFEAAQDNLLMIVWPFFDFVVVVIICWIFVFSAFFFRVFNNHCNYTHLSIGPTDWRRFDVLLFSWLSLHTQQFQICSFHSPFSTILNFCCCCCSLLLLLYFYFYFILYSFYFITLHMFVASDLPLHFIV